MFSILTVSALGWSLSLHQLQQKILKNWFTVLAMGMAANFNLKIMSLLHLIIDWKRIGRYSFIVFWFHPIHFLFKTLSIMTPNPNFEYLDHSQNPTLHSRLSSHQNIHPPLLKTRSQLTLYILICSPQVA